MHGCHLYDFAHRRVTDTSCRIVDDTAQGLLVIRIGYHTEIGYHILYLLTLIERQATVNSIRYAILAHLFLKATTLGIRTIENGKIRIVATFLPSDAFDVVTYYHRLLLVTISRFQHQPFTLFILAEHFLMYLALIFTNKAVGGLHNELC